MDKFEKEEMKKKRPPAKKYLEPVKKTMGSVSEKIMCLFKTNTTKHCYKPLCGGAKEPRKPKIEKQLGRDMIKDIRNLFKLKKENKLNKDE